MKPRFGVRAAWEAAAMNAKPCWFLSGGQCGCQQPTRIGKERAQLRLQELPIGTNQANGENPPVTWTCHIAAKNMQR